MVKDYKVNVYDEEGKVVARVQYNSNLDFWNGSNWTSGGTGRHLGITKLKKSNRFVLIHGTQWQGEQDIAEVISDEDAYQTIVRMGHDEMLEQYPELKRFDSNVETEEI